MWKTSFLPLALFLALYPAPWSAIQIPTDVVLPFLYGRTISVVTKALLQVHGNVGAAPAPPTTTAAPTTTPPATTIPATTEGSGKAAALLLSQLLILATTTFIIVVLQI
jgi:hypothetical protein